MSKTTEVHPAAVRAARQLVFTGSPVVIGGEALRVARIIDAEYRPALADLADALQQVLAAYLIPLGKDGKRDAVKQARAALKRAGVE